MEISDHQGKVKPRSRNHSNNAMLFDLIELIEVRTVKSVAIPCEIYETAVGVTISDAYEC